MFGSRGGLKYLNSIQPRILKHLPLIFIHRSLKVETLISLMTLLLVELRGVLSRWV